MLSKEEINRVNEILSCDNCPTSYACEGCDITQNDKLLIKKYISELEISNKELDKENNRLEKIEFERDMANKMIDEITTMLEELKICHFKREDGGELLGKYRCYNKEDWKQYFEKKVEEK